MQKLFRNKVSKEEARRRKDEEELKKLCTQESQFSLQFLTALCARRVVAAAGVICIINNAALVMVSIIGAQFE